jgi:SAM-dependent methyltransferase
MSGKFSGFSMVCERLALFPACLAGQGRCDRLAATAWNGVENGSMITREDVCFAYRLFLDREPESEEVISDLLRIANTTAELRGNFLDSAEYQAKTAPVTIGGAVVPLDWPVRGEVSKDFARRLRNGFFSQYLSGEKILDIGFRGYEGSAPILPHAIGIDLDYPGYDGITLPFPEDSVDAVFSSHMLEHAADYCAVIQDWHRVLKIGGFIMCIVPHQFLYEKKSRPPSRWNADHKRFYTPASLLAEFEAALAPNSYRVRHLADNDRGYTYDIGPDRHSGGGYEIELVVEKIWKPGWQIDP